jgi:hypothetical protein
MRLVLGMFHQKHPNGKLSAVGILKEEYWWLIRLFHQSTTGAEGIFKEALAEFSAEFSKDGKQQQWITDSKYGNFESVLASVEEAQVYYEERKGNSKLRKKLVHLSEKLYSYSSIMDVLLPQQPEYSTLAYSAMKFLLLVGLPLAIPFVSSCLR